MDKNYLINRYKCGERNFVRVNLSGADLSGADLSGADLSGADLRSANLSKAVIRSADLGSANFSEANLSGANLSKANLGFADLGSANLSGANLSGANLSKADLGSANLSDADLSFANLRCTKFGDTNLRGTVLDPMNEFDPLSEEEFLRAGFEVDDGMVIGYRTNRSVVCGDTTYIPGKTYTAPVFSTDTETECHPGIYLAPLSWMKREYKGWSLVKVSAAIPDVLRCGDKWRAREIVVIEDYEEK